MRLQVENGGFYYEKNRPVLEHINFEIHSGEIMAVLGANGAGKTTLLRCLMGMEKWKCGRSLLDGEDIAAMRPKKLWSKMAYVPQTGTAGSAYTVMEMGLLGRGSRLGFLEKPGMKDVEIVRRILRFLGIAHLEEKQCAKISGGELQMVLIARALAAEPEILILDEPEANLDLRNQWIVLEIMSRLAEKGMTCIFNTHDPSHALEKAGKSLLLLPSGGTIFGETKNVITESTLEEAFGIEAVIGEIRKDERVVPTMVSVGITDHFLI